VGEVEQQHDAEEIDGDAGEDVEAGEGAVGAVLEQDPSALGEADPRLAAELGAFEAHRVDGKPGHDEPDADDHARLLPGLGVASEPVRERLHGDCAEGSEDGRAGAVGVDRGALVVVGRHLGQEREVGHRDTGHGEAHPDVDRGVVGELGGLGLEGGVEPHQGEEQAQRERADQEVRPPPPRLPAGQVRDRVRPGP
jgi:hypothetical protein